MLSFVRVLLIPNNQHRGKRRGVERHPPLLELQAPAYELYARFVVDEVMEIARIRPRWYEHDHAGVLRFLGAFPHPLAHIAAVWRIAEHYLPRPRLREAVFFFRVMLFTFRVLVRAAWVEREMVFSIKAFIQ